MARVVSVRVGGNQQKQELVVVRVDKRCTSRYQEKKNFADFNGVVRNAGCRISLVVPSVHVPNYLGF